MTDDSQRDERGRQRWTPPAPAELQAIAGYAVERLVGRGGMAAVYRARRRRDGLAVALKVARPADTRAKGYRAVLAHEAHVLSRLDHPHIARYVESGDDGNLMWIAMELVEGPTLRQRMDAARLAPDYVLRLAMELANALAHLHGRGVIHHDLKPDNVLTAADGGARIIDFGLAKVRNLSYTINRPGRVSGTLRYMAPEQFLHPRDTDQRIDIYALGVLLHEMLTGRLPAAGELPRRRDDSGGGIVAGCLQCNPNDRWHSAEQLIDALREPAALDELIELRERGARRATPLAGLAGPGPHADRDRRAAASTHDMDLRADAGVDRTPTPVP